MGKKSWETFSFINSCGISVWSAFNRLLLPRVNWELSKTAICYGLKAADFLSGRPFNRDSAPRIKSIFSLIIRRSVILCLEYLFYCFLLCFQLYTGFLQLHNRNEPCLYGIQCYICYVVTIVLHVMLFPTINVSYFYISTFQSMSAVRSMAVICSSFDVVLSWYVFQVLSDWFWDGSSCPYSLLPSFLFLHSTYIILSIATSLNFKILEASYLITSVSPEIAIRINRHVLLSLSGTIRSGLMLGTAASLFNYLFRNMVTLSSWHVSTNFGTCSYEQCSFSNVTHTPLHMLSTQYIMSLYIFIIIIIIIIIIIH